MKLVCVSSSQPLSSGDTWRHLEVFLVVTTGECGWNWGCYWQLVGRACGRHSTSPSTQDTLTTKTSQAPNINSTEVERACWCQKADGELGTSGLRTLSWSGPSYFLRISINCSWKMVSELLETNDFVYLKKILSEVIKHWPS